MSRTPEATSAESLLEAVDDLLSRLASERPCDELFTTLLQHTLKLTQSRFGLVGEVCSSGDDPGRLHLRAAASDGVIWSSGAKGNSDAAGPVSPDAVADLFRQTIEEGAITRLPSSPADGVAQLGDIPLENSLGLPLTSGGKTVGLIVLGNRPGGFDNNFGDAITPLLHVSACLIRARQSREQHDDDVDRLRVSEEHFRSLVNNIPGVTYRCEYDGEQWITRYVSDVSESLAGYPSSLFIDQPLERYYSIVYPEDIPSVRNALTKVEEECIADPVEHRLIRKDGEIIWVRSRSNVVCDLDGRPRWLNGVVIDITDRKQTEQSLAQVNALKEAVINAASEVSIISTDREGKVTLFNRGAERLLGYTADEVVGRATPALFHLESEVNRRSAELSAQLGERIEGFRTFIAVAERNGSDDRVWMYVRKDGSCVPVRVVVTPIRDEQNETQGYLGIAVDITTTQLIEEQLRHAKTTAEMANQLKSRFLAHMSHEIRTPLAAVIGVAEILEEEARSERDRKSASLIIANGRHLLELINGILDLSKIEAGRLQIESIVCHPARLVRDASDLLQLQARQKGLELKLDLDKSFAAPVVTDPTRVRQILLNLMGNAIKFTPSGRVIIRGKQQIRDDGAPWLVIDVIDTGIGLDKEQVKRLFQPFEQADTSTTRRFGGTGLGLSVSRRLAELLGGDLTVESSPGEGSRFTLAIPVTFAEQPARVEPEPATAPTVSASWSGRRFLVAEDGQVNQHLLRYRLSQRGGEVDVVEDGKAAVHQVLTAEETGDGYDLVLMDIEMPEMDGHQATRELRRSGFRKPIIALTANAMSGDRERCLQAGCDGYLTKPIDWRRFEDIIQSQLKQPARS
ncbi:Autoinducer 2 sensor kinase/phosphatase LuxQ [Maioricimonas rarisocia]|uniref:histidine kinase n=1 Tax=Maioricimonas rarisocia TaxID=2528026 RepID=A0A517Z7M1_9PLAN|nr:PAS domain S-box protein [Maioricimonas rarisocia]QDU38483.1 Autoinducer 2 sensor kinase/phosphatase LuxQ [Maioricimonas rarisocia]